MGFPINSSACHCRVEIVENYSSILFDIYSSIQNYDKHYSSTGSFETLAFFRAVGDFCRIFTLSLIIGAAMGCITALMTKFTRIRDFPLLESALFVLMSYSTFLIAEATELTGKYMSSDAQLLLAWFVKRNRN